MDDVLIFVNHAQLQRHPRNMRRTYAAGDVRRMAVSQLERARRCGALLAFKPEDVEAFKAGMRRRGQPK